MLKSYWIYALLLFTSTTFLVAQSDLMQDVDAVKEGNDDDLYAPDESAKKTPEKTTSPLSETPTTNSAAPAAPKNENAIGLDDLPLSSDPKTITRPDSALTGLTAGPAAELSAMRVYPLKDRIRIELQTSKAVDYLPEKVSKNNQFVMNLANTQIGSSVARKPVSASSYGGSVSQLQAYESKSASGTNTRVVINLSSMADPIIRQEGNRLWVEFLNDGSEAYSNTNRSSSAISNELPEYETLITMTGKKNFRGTKVNFRAKDANVTDVLSFLSQVSGKNFVLASETEKKVTLSVRNEPWDQLLALVLLGADLGYQKVGNTYRVMPVTKIRTELTEASKAQDEEDKLAPKATQLFPLSYSKTAEMLPQIQKFLKSDFGETVVQDDRTNSIVVTALPKNIQRIRKYIAAIDKQTPVIQIEARVVQATKNFSRQFGIDWGALSALSMAGGVVRLGAIKGTPLIPATIAVSTDSGSNTSSGSSAGSESSIGGNGSNSIFGQYTNSKGTIREIDAVLKLSETDDRVKELSRPSLTVLNNKKASIIDGTEFTFINTSSTTSPATAQTIRAVLGLSVTPQVTNDNNILMSVQLSRDLPGAAPLTGAANVAISKREINTETMIESGATMAIGGVYIREESNGEAGWPFLRKIPIFGNLFNSTTKRDAERELIMFIAPRILNLEKSSLTAETLEEAR